MLWVMIDNLSMLGKHIPCSTLAIECEKVRSNDIRSRRVYHREVKKEYVRQNIIATKEKMHKEARRYKQNRTSPRSQRFKATIEKRFDDFHSKTRKIKLKVAEKMRKKYAGKQSFSPKYRIYSETINFWKKMVKLRKNVNTSKIIL